uniref:Uncharacterized protein n=1 Tax=Meloidogyne floridensis TaxID=298350 RepID=A0A915NCC1_9BILA
MADLHSKGSEGSLLDIYSFMENASSLNFPKSLFNVTALNSLKIIFNLSKIQSKEMDKAIIEVIYNQHLENKKKLSKEYKNVIVEVDGPVGLYAAFKLFMEGMNVTAMSISSTNVDDTIKLDAKWMSDLFIFLGTEFEKLFPEEEESKITNFENALKERLNVLSNFVREKGQNSVLKLLSDKKVLEINTANGNPKAILDKFDKEKNVEIPFDLFFCDFIKQIKYGAVILNKKDNNKRIFNESKFSINIKMNSSILFEDFEKLIEKSLFLSQKIRHRYFYIVWVIYFGMKVVKNNSQSSLTRTGKVYKIFDDGRLWYNNPSDNSENISVQIKETKTKIQIDSNIPIAIVELIEEVKNEREELEEMSDEEFKKKWNEYIIGEVKYKHNKELNERLEEVKNEQETILKEDLKELNFRKEHLVKEIKDFEMKRKNLKLSKKLAEKVDKRDEILEELKDIKMGNNKERKGKFKKIKEMILKGKSKRKQKKIWKSSQMFNEEYDSEDLMNKEIEENKIFLEELQKLDEKYLNGGIENIKTEEGKKLKESLKLYKEYKKIEKEIKELESERDSLDVSKILEEKINEKEEILREIKEIEDNNYKEKVEKLDKIRNEQEKILMEKLEKIKFENDKIMEGELEGERKKMLKKYDDFIVELKERWFKAIFYHVLDKECKDEDKKNVKIELSKKSEEKGEASTSYNADTLQNKQEEHVLYFDKNSLIGKTFLLKIYGKENAVKLVKGKKDSAIFVNISDDGNTRLFDVEKTVSAIKEYSKNSEQKDLAEMLIEVLKKPELN